MKENLLNSQNFVISPYSNLAKEFAEKNTEEFIEKYKDVIDWNVLTKKFKLTDEQIDNYGQYFDFLHVLTNNNNIKYSLLDKYKDKVYWDLVTPTQTLTEKFMRDHKDLLCWSDIPIYQKLSESFIEEFETSLDWFSVSVNQHMSDEFISYFRFRVHPTRRKFNNSVEYKGVTMTWNELIDKCSSHIERTNILVKLTEETNMEAFNWYMHKRKEPLTDLDIEHNIKYFPWGEVLQYQKTSEYFINRHLKRFRLMNIFHKQKVSERFIIKHVGDRQWYWDIISMNQPLTEGFIEDHADKINWGRLGVKYELTEKFLKRHMDKLNWNIISKYQALSNGFIEQYSDKIDPVRLKYNKSFIYSRDVGKPEDYDIELFDIYNKYWGHDEEITWNDIVEKLEYYPITWLYSLIENTI